MSNPSVLGVTLTPSAFLTPGAFGSAIETTVANIASPTELNTLGTAQGEIRLARTTEAGTGNQTWYYLDTTSDAQSLPYIVTSATAGLKWIAFGGRYQNEAFSLLGAAVMASTLNVTGAVTLTVPLASTSGGTGINNAGTITNASNLTVTGGGTIALGGFTLTVPATGTAALLGTANVFTALQTVNVANASIAHALLVLSSGLTANQKSSLVIGRTQANNEAFYLAFNYNTTEANRYLAIQDYNNAVGTKSLVAYSDGGVDIGNAAAGTSPGAGLLRLAITTGTHSILSTTDSTTKDTGSIVTEGGIGVEKAVFIGTNLTVAGTTEASAVGTAAAIVVGGLGIAKRSYLGTIGSAFKGNVLAGVQDATAAAAGQVGEVMESVVSGVAVASTGTVGNVTSVTLTPGDWLISGFVVISGGTTGLTSGSTAKMSVVTTTATNGTSGSTMTQESILALLANGLFEMTIPQLRVNISASTTYYMTEEVTFALGSPTVAGTLRATRMR